MKKADIILIISVLLLAGAIALGLGAFGREGELVRVEVNGKPYTVMSLDLDASLEIKTEHGTNLLVIKDGRAEISDADCPDKICVKHRSISKTGESIICLPHRVVVTITGGGGTEPDAVA